MVTIPDSQTPAMGGVLPMSSTLNDRYSAHSWGGQPSSGLLFVNPNPRLVVRMGQTVRHSSPKQLINRSTKKRNFISVHPIHTTHPKCLNGPVWSNLTFFKKEASFASRRGPGDVLGDSSCQASGSQCRNRPPLPYSAWPSPALACPRNETSLAGTGGDSVMRTGDSGMRTG